MKRETLFMWLAIFLFGVLVGALSVAVYTPLAPYDSETELLRDLESGATLPE